MVMPAVERLVNLTVALLETRRPLTFEELRHRTGYYPQSDAASARRMFERDKETLRSLGVPIETRQDFGMEDPGYLIDRRTYELRGVDLDAEEVAALALAVEMLSSSEGALPLAKVAARAPDPVPLDRPSTRIGIPVTDIDPFAPAIVERRVVRFEYRTADGRTSHRTVEPYGIVRRRRAWYLVGRDRDRAQVRGFRTDRMLGAIEVMDAAAAFEVPAVLDLAAVVSGPENATMDVVIEAQHEARWELERRGAYVEEEAGRGELEDSADDPVTALTEPITRRLRLDGVDPFRDRAWLLAIAPEAAVRSPEELQASLRAALERIRVAHGGTEAAALQEVER